MEERNKRKNKKKDNRRNWRRKENKKEIEVLKQKRWLWTRGIRPKAGDQRSLRNNDDEIKHDRHKGKFPQQI